MNKKERVMEKIREAMALWHGDQKTKVTIREAVYEAIKDELNPHYAPKIRKIPGSGYWVCNGSIGNTPRDAYRTWKRHSF